MACTAPFPAVRAVDGSLRFGVSVAFSGELSLLLPCGSCLGCQMSRAREWTYRCVLEYSQHADSCWCTLTYSDQYVPPTLSKGHATGFLKRLRSRMPEVGVRFLLAGEYGETEGRPHYHAILFGVSVQRLQHELEERVHRFSLETVKPVWPFGFVRVDPLSPKSIAYVAGYCFKKVGFDDRKEERVDRSTGECYVHQPPFRLVSKRPGLGGWARKHAHQFRDHAVLDGTKIPVPRLFKEAWKAQASEEEIRELELEQAARVRPSSEQLEAQAHINEARVFAASRRRKL